MNLKKIIKEEIDGFKSSSDEDWGWTEDTDESYALSRQRFEEYISGKSPMTPIMNLSIGRDPIKNFFHDVGTYLNEKGFGQGGDRREYDAIMYLTSLLNENVLKSAFGEPINHDEFGEGFEDDFDDDGEETESYRGYSFSSWFIELNGILFHIGVDHRGTKIELKVKSRKDHMVSAIKELIDKTIQYI